MIQPVDQALQSSASLVICLQIQFRTLVVVPVWPKPLAHQGHWLPKVTVNSPAVELNCVQCADPVLFWSGHPGGVVRHMYPVCQQHLPQQVSKALLRIAFSA